MIPSPNKKKHNKTMMIIDSNPSIVSGQIKIKAKKLIQPKTSVK